MYEVYQDHPKQAKLNVRVVLAIAFLICAIGTGIFLITRLVSKPLTKEEARAKAGIVYDSAAVEGGWDNLSPEEIAEKLNEKVGNYIYEAGIHRLIKMKKSGISRCGTGDIFSAIISASLVRGNSLFEAVTLAAQFIRKCITVSDSYNIPLTDGVAFEDVLYMLTPHRDSHSNNH